MIQVLEFYFGLGAIGLLVPMLFALGALSWGIDTTVEKLLYWLETRKR